MPILSYLAVVGSVLAALLFVADATLPKSDAPVVTTSSVVGLPKPWRPDPQVKSLAAKPAPAPDMSSEAVLAAAPQIEPAPVRTASEHPAQDHVATADPARKKKRVARKQPRRNDDGHQSFAWSRNSDREFFGGTSFFGRF